MVDDSYWTSRSSWYRPTIGTDEFAAILGILPASIRQNLLIGAQGFPQPMATRGRANLWRPSDIYDYIRRYRPAVIERIPRLYPGTTGLNAAQFMFAELIEIPDEPNWPPFVVHAWRTSDGAPVIAVAYTATRHRGDDRPRAEALDWAAAAAALREQLRWTSAVALLTALARQLPDSSDFEPVVMVADNSGSPRENGWWDVANLLRTDIPWWSSGLTEIDDMLAWRPGRPIQIIGARDEFNDPAALTAIIDDDTPDHVRQPLRLLEARVLRRTCPTYERHDGHDDTVEQPGLIHATAADLSALDEGAGEPTAEQLAAVLRHQVTGSARRQAVITQGGQWKPVICRGIAITPNDRVLAQEWVAQLKPVPDRRHEIGFAYLARYMESDAPAEWLEREALPDVWIVRGLSGTVYATLPTHVPAHGRLEAAVIDRHCAFFADSDNAIWPLPDTGFGTYTTGYDGSGPARLVATLTALRADASADVSRATGYDENGPLWRRITTEQPPVVVTTADFDGA
jgi:hypothetical protein